MSKTEESLVPYQDMMERALRRVMRDALALVEEEGLPGNHHYYVSFLTQHEGVAIPDHLRARYPDEMTIVLQHQFWGLGDGRGRVLGHPVLRRQVGAAHRALRGR